MGISGSRCPPIDVASGTQTVIDWVVEYFSGPAKKRGNLEDALRGASPIMSTDRMPLVLQHAGHSRTIIGYEQTKNGVNLLLFDPSKSVSQLGI
jgi:hypothetical protein